MRRRFFETMILALIVCVPISGFSTTMKPEEFGKEKCLGFLAEEPSASLRELIRLGSRLGDKPSITLKFDEAYNSIARILPKDSISIRSEMSRTVKVPLEVPGTFKKTFVRSTNLFGLHFVPSSHFSALGNSFSVEVKDAFMWKRLMTFDQRNTSTNATLEFSRINDDGFQVRFSRDDTGLEISELIDHTPPAFTLIYDSLGRLTNIELEGTQRYLGILNANFKIPVRIFYPDRD